jgi:hypothetical protein
MAFRQVARYHGMIIRIIRLSAPFLTLGLLMAIEDRYKSETWLSELVGNFLQGPDK